MSEKRPSVAVSVKHTGGMAFEAQGAHLNLAFDTAQTSPKEMFLAGMLGCSAYDMMMSAQDRGLSNLTLSVLAHPASQTPPHRFERFELLYSFDSSASDSEAIAWVEASLERHCTTINSFRGALEVSYSLIHNGTKILNQRKLF